MSDLLWQKPGVTVDAGIQAFLAGDDVILDREFFLYDIRASKAHAQGLQHIGPQAEIQQSDIGIGHIAGGAHDREAVGVIFRLETVSVIFGGDGLLDRDWRCSIGQRRRRSAALVT